MMRLSLFVIAVLALALSLPNCNFAFTTETFISSLSFHAGVWGTITHVIWSVFADGDFPYLQCSISSTCSKSNINLDLFLQCAELSSSSQSIYNASCPTYIYQLSSISFLDTCHSNGNFEVLLPFDPWSVPVPVRSCRCHLEVFCGGPRRQ